MQHLPREQAFVDVRVQGALVLRSILYWLLGVLSTVCTLYLVRVLRRPPQVAGSHFDDLSLDLAITLAVAGLFLPVVVFDAARHSVRFCGPLMRLRDGWRRMARGESVEPIALRDRDYWREASAEFNGLATQMGTLASQHESGTVDPRAR